MSTIVTRAGKGTALSYAEMDANFTNLNNDKLEASALASYATQTDLATTNSTVAGKQDALPSQTGNNGKFLGTNGATLSWNTVDALPLQTGNAGKYLTTNGTIASWTTFSGVSLTGVETLTNKTLTTPVINTNINYSGTGGTIQVNGVDKVTIGANGISAGSFAPNSIDAAAAALAFSGANQSLAANGYQKLPGGLIIQWGISGVVAADTLITVTFPIAFPNAVLTMSATDYSGVSSKSVCWAVDVPTLSGCQLHWSPGASGVGVSSTRPARWIAIGY